MRITKLLELLLFSQSDFDSRLGIDLSGSGFPLVLVWVSDSSVRFFVITLTSEQHSFGWLCLHTIRSCGVFLAARLLYCSLRITFCNCFAEKIPLPKMFNFSIVVSHLTHVGFLGAGCYHFVIIIFFFLFSLFSFSIPNMLFWLTILFLCFRWTVFLPMGIV